MTISRTRLRCPWSEVTVESSSTNRRNNRGLNLSKPQGKAYSRAYNVPFRTVSSGTLIGGPFPSLFRRLLPAGEPSPDRNCTASATRKLSVFFFFAQGRVQDKRGYEDAFGPELMSGPGPHGHGPHGPGPQVCVACSCSCSC